MEQGTLALQPPHNHAPLHVGSSPGRLAKGHTGLLPNADMQFTAEDCHGPESSSTTETVSSSTGFSPACIKDN